MSLPRFYCPTLAGDVVTLPPEETRHALGSRRLSPGDALELFDGCGRVARGRVLPPPAPDAGRRRPAKSAAVLSVALETVQTCPAPVETLTLIVAACKGPRLDWLVEKTTELGVTELVFAPFERSVVRLRDEQAAGLQRTALEACKQCGRNWLPQIRIAADLAECTRDAAAHALFVAHVDSAAMPLAHALQHTGERQGSAEQGAARAADAGSADASSADAYSAAVHSSAAHSPAAHSANSRPAAVAVVIGPEGGLTPAEVATLVASGGRVVSLAMHTLRVETAAVAAAAIWGGSQFG